MIRFKDKDYNTLVLTFDKNSDMVPINLVSAIPMREFKNKRNVKQYIKKINKCFTFFCF